MRTDRDLDDGVLAAELSWPDAQGTDLHCKRRLEIAHVGSNVGPSFIGTDSTSAEQTR